MTRPVRVALVGDVPLDDANAPGSRLLWLARSLRDRGFDVVAGGIRGRGPAPDVPAVALPDPAPATPWGRFFRQHGVALRLLARAEVRRADAFWVRGSSLAAVFAIYGRLAGKPVLWDFHGFSWLEQHGAAIRPRQRIEAAYTRGVEALTVALSKGVVAAGEGPRWLLARRHPKKPCRLLPNGIAAEAFAAPRDPEAGRALKAAVGIAPEAPVVIFLGHRRADWWLAAFGPLAEAVAPARLVVIGEGFDAPSPGPAAPVFLGGRSHDEAAAWLVHAADVAVIPYRADWFNARTPHFLDGSRKLMEYAAAGLPVVLPDIPARPSFMEPGRHYLPYAPDKVDDLVAQVRRLLDDPASRSRMGEANRALAGDFAWGRLLDASGVVEALRGDAGGHGA